MKTRTKIEFLNKLADLLEEYNAAICARKVKGSDKYAEAFLQLYDGKEEHVNLENGRCHSSAYEYRVDALHLIDELDKKIDELSDDARKYKEKSDG